MMPHDRHKMLSARTAVVVGSLLLASSLSLPMTISAQEPAPPRAPLDVTGNGVINDADASQLVNAWIDAQEQNQCNANGGAAYDFSGNGCLDVADIQTVLSAWGEPADPNMQLSDEGSVSALANAPLVVNSLGDEPDANTGDGRCATAAGQCTLRSAIQQSNVNAGHDTITFSLGSCEPGNTTPLTINVASTTTTMLVLDDAGKAGVTIDGYTQCNSRPNTQAVHGDAIVRVEVKGRAQDTSLTFEQKSGVYGLHVASPNNVIRGLALWAWDINLLIAGTSAKANRIEGNFIGSNATLTKANVNGPDFKYPSNGGGDALQLKNFANGNIIGGTAPAQRNIISGGWDGLSMEYRTLNTRVYNNYIGLKQDGVTMWRNGGDGVDINLGSQGNIVGGTGPGERNIISGNGSDGVEVSHSPAQDGAATANNKIIGNYIGPTATGGKTTRPSWAFAGNLSSGVTLEDNVTTVEIAHNVISDNGHNGVRLHSRISYSFIHENLIGVAPNGTTAMPNGVSTETTLKFYKGHNGVGIYGDSNHNVVADNVIAYNKGYGVWISNGYTDYKELENKQTDYNTVSRNRIFGNGDWEYLVEPAGSDIYEGVQKGIRLKDQDGDVPNLGIRRPSISSAYTNIVKGSAKNASGNACSGCTIEVFIADTTSADNANGEDYGQGKTFIGAGVTDSNGSFAVAVNDVSGGQIVTATTTDPDGNTSQFARNVQVKSGQDTTTDPSPIPPPAPNRALPNPVWLPIVRK